MGPCRHVLTLVVSICVPARTPRETQAPPNRRHPTTLPAPAALAPLTTVRHLQPVRRDATRTATDVTRPRRRHASTRTRGCRGLGQHARVDRDTRHRGMVTRIRPSSGGCRFLDRSTECGWLREWYVTRSVWVSSRTGACGEVGEVEGGCVVY